MVIRESLKRSKAAAVSIGASCLILTPGLDTYIPSYLVKYLDNFYHCHSSNRMVISLIRWLDQPGKCGV